MTTLNDFKALRASVPAEVQKELYSLFTSNPDAARQRMVEPAAEQDVTLSVDEVSQFPGYSSSLVTADYWTTTQQSIK